MSLSIFDNRSGYRPSPKLISWWLLLPQITTTHQGANKMKPGRIPPIFSDPSSVIIHYVLVGLLIYAEITLMLNLEKNGLEIPIMLILSILDFVVALLPILIIKSRKEKIYPSQIAANIFVQEVKIAYAEKENIDKSEAYKQLDEWKKKENTLSIINLTCILLLLVFCFGKFWSVYQILGDDIFSEVIGRFTFGVVLLSFIVHLISTKVVFAHVPFFFILKQEKKQFERGENYKISPQETNKNKIIVYNGEFREAMALNQKVLQESTREEYFKEKDNHSDSVIMLSQDKTDYYYRKQNFTQNQNICIVTTGLLTDSEIQSLASSQSDLGLNKLLLIATCKEYQLSQI